MSQSINCSSCGASNLLPKGKVSMFCDFCGTTIQNIVLDDKSDEKIYQEYFNKAIIEFRDNNYEKCIKTLNKIIAKQKDFKNAILYKLMCELNTNFNLINFLSKLQQYNITKIEEFAEDDLYTTLRNQILPKYYNLELKYDKTFCYFEKLIEFLNFQNDIFKLKVLGLIPQIYSWDNHKSYHKFYFHIDDKSEDWEGVGYRPQMIDEVKILMNLFYVNKVEISVVNLFIVEIKRLITNSTSYYFEEIQKNYLAFKANKEYPTIYHVNNLIKSYFEINDTQSLLKILEEFEKKININTNINELTKEINSLNNKVKLITEELSKLEEREYKLNWKLYLFLFVIIYLCYEWFKG